MKRHLALMVALVTVAVTLALLVWFIPRTRRIVAAQASPNLHLPVAPPEPAVDESGSLKVTVAVDGTVSSGGKSFSEAALGEILAARPGRPVIIETEPGLKYEQLKAFLFKLQAAGAKNVTLKASPGGK